MLKLFWKNKAEPAAEAIGIANAARSLIDIAPATYNGVHIQKVLYLAQVVHLGRYGLPLFVDQMRADKLGPLNWELYHKTSVYGRMTKLDRFRVEPMTDPDKIKILEEVHEAFKDFTPAALISLIYEDGSAWSQYYGKHNDVITHSAMIGDYHRMLAKAA